MLRRFIPCNVTLMINFTPQNMTTKLRQYYQDYKLVFDDNFKIVLENFDVEAIHKMRTSTKRLRALFLLLEYMTDKKFKAKKQLRKIRFLFKFTGRVRELQIEQQLILTYQTQLGENYAEYIEYLKIREHRAISRFLKHLPQQADRSKILNDKKVNAVFDKMDKGVYGNKASAFIQAKQNSINKLVEQAASNSRIHGTRTHLKQLYYLFDILTDLTDTTGILGMTNLKMREVEQYLGTWHDLVNSPVYMNAFLKTKKPRDNKKYLVLKKEITTDRKAMRKEIIKNIYPSLKA